MNRTFQFLRSPYVIVSVVLTIVMFLVGTIGVSITIGALAAAATAAEAIFVVSIRAARPSEPTVTEAPEPFRYPDGFLPRDQLRREDELKTNLDAFEKTNFRVMGFSNNEGDEVWFGELLGFRVVGGSALPIVRLDNGKEIFSMGFVLPLWEELAEFLAKQESRERFWRMVTLVHGWNGLERFDQIVWSQRR